MFTSPVVTFAVTSVMTQFYFNCKVVNCFTYLFIYNLPSRVYQAQICLAGCKEMAGKQSSINCPNSCPTEPKD